MLLLSLQTLQALQALQLENEKLRLENDNLHTQLSVLGRLCDTESYQHAHVKQRLVRFQADHLDVQPVYLSCF